MRPSDLDLDLEAFAGPFDLLCTVLLRGELPLSDVRFAEVVVAYLQRAAVEGEIDPETASEFLVLVAALLELKVRDLLAIDEAVEIEQPTVCESQEEMLQRLLRYSTFRTAAEWLSSRGSRQRYWRIASRPVIRRRETYTGPTMQPHLLRDALQGLMRQPDVDVRHLVGRHMSVQEMTSRLLTLVTGRSSMRFEDAVADCSRLDQAVAFVAMLELVRAGRLVAQQETLFGDIEIAAAQSVTIAQLEESLAETTAPEAEVVAIA